MFGSDESRKRAKEMSDYCIIGIPDVITHGAFAKTTRKMGIAESVTCFFAKVAYQRVGAVESRETEPALQQKPVGVGGKSVVQETVPK
jgi:hypothetical protein